MGTPLTGDDARRKYVPFSSTLPKCATGGMNNRTTFIPIDGAGHALLRRPAGVRPEAAVDGGGASTSLRTHLKG